MISYSKSEQYEYIFKNLGKNDANSKKLFESMKDVYMIAFLIGAFKNNKEKITKKSQDPIKEIYFDDEDKLLMKLIALYYSKDINILKNSEQNKIYVHNMVEEYTNYGIKEFDRILDGDHYNLDNLINTVKSFEKIDKPKKANIEDLLFDINNTL